jgi:hypothetical protein
VPPRRCAMCSRATRRRRECLGPEIADRRTHAKMRRSRGAQPVRRWPPHRPQLNGHQSVSPFSRRRPCIDAGQAAEVATTLVLVANDGGSAAPVFNLQSLPGAIAFEDTGLVVDQTQRLSAIPGVMWRSMEMWRARDRRARHHDDVPLAFVVVSGYLFMGVSVRHVALRVMRFVNVGSRDERESMHLPECPYERVAVDPAGDPWEYTGCVIHDTRGRRVSPSLFRARQRLLRCRQMTNSPPLVQASGGLLVSGGHRALLTAAPKS